MELQLKTEYWDDAKATGAFKAFVQDIHGLDFSEWESSGYWDNAYTPFSFFKDGAVVSSVCIYLLDAVIEGKATHLVQISAVGTLPELRRKGLNRELTRIGLDWADGRHEGIFLFAATGAVPYYETCGFRPIPEFVEVLDAPEAAPVSGARRLDPAKKEDREAIYRFAQERSPVSNRFAVLNAKLLMFHALYDLRSDVYEIPALDCLVFYQRTKDRLCVLDIVGRTMPKFSDLHPFIADPGDRVIEFHFRTDKLGLGKTGMKPLVGNHPFVMEPFPLKKPVFPFTSRA